MPVNSHFKIVDTLFNVVQASLLASHLREHTLDLSRGLKHALLRLLLDPLLLVLHQIQRPLVVRHY